LEEIELQDSAYPYHDWNERITAECYAPNAASRILDDENYIARIVNNYAKISFNFGPTLLSWLEQKSPDTYAAILAADRQSQERFSGHGSALAQAYNHLILPLAHERDKRTQIRWGVADFERRFGRPPEGMWLPETAVDVESLELLAEAGLRFTVLAPHQAARVRGIGEKEWRPVDGGVIDPTMVYAARLPSGRKLALFFYDGPVSRAVAFDGLLRDGQTLARRLTGGYSDDRPWAQLSHIATDGETYGHHHAHGDMALAYALRYIESEGLAKLTNYGEYLEKHPPTHEAEIFDNTSWSCHHGVERWRSDCGCRMRGEWRQTWRGPLREALDWLRDTIAPLFEAKGKQLLNDPWAARDGYINVVLDRSADAVAAFVDRHAFRPLEGEERVRALKLLEMQRHAMLMYTSCGWFFDDISGIETVQILQYAGRTIQLAEEVFGVELETRFCQMLEKAPSNVPEHGDGARIYQKWVKAATVDLAKVAAHYAVSSLFEAYPDRARLACYAIEREDANTYEAGRAKLGTGRVRVASEITGESGIFSYAAFNWGDHNLSGGVRPYRGDDDVKPLTTEIAHTFARADFADVVRLLDRHFQASSYSLRSLFRDEQRKILRLILSASLTEAEAVQRQVYERHAPLMRFLSDLQAPAPRAFQAAAEFVLNADLRRLAQDETPDPERLQTLLDEVQRWGVELDKPSLSYVFKDRLQRLGAALREHPTDLALLRRLDLLVGMARRLPVEVDLWNVQNIYYGVAQSVAAGLREAAGRGDESAQQWAAHFDALGSRLMVRNNQHQD
ncbi:MAG: DUF3536 domain-containing protein, partial [Chloroflexi bacterium]|nr:DUF3536 domain-containing protein [Chloroflexota bacterium]